MSWFCVDTINDEILLTCYVCGGGIKVKAPCEIPAWERAVRKFRKDHKACAPPKNAPMKILPCKTRYEQILKDDD